MRVLFIGIAIVFLAIGAVVLGILNKPGLGVVLLTMLIMSFIFALAIGLETSEISGGDETSECMLFALYTASVAIHAFEDAEGQMPAETGEFAALKNAVAAVDRAIDVAMEVE